ncbi:F-box/FBD/LRR-repeat protein At5g53840 isoform X2 [Sesamum indicum]|uniref:F-box/FBD/LRR-repeat protein At5g53840 isoform X2 n=1 Tax=Sesamum indicum TaxID=4182 RepID=A0A6I9T1J6_SESIN|nr:F-box/FBD/LRR-repeat protein At5g53840 isoform X2 [Sesamum indicum]XP_020549260.1 F-box/FBD/LRR-repeat protein At5g53840 isoform X2 [Sesamum indicum]
MRKRARLAEPKGAAVTSNLSRRWRYLWTHVAALDFDANDTLDRIAADAKLRSSERAKYINWVNRVVRQHVEPTLDAVRICFDLDKSSKCAIDNWVKFAIAKRVQRLELDLLENGETLRQPMRNYTFPYKQLIQSKGSSLKNVYSNFARTQPCMSTGLKCLKALSLKCVNVNEEALQCFLSNCPVLQYLTIHGSGDLVHVKISGLSLMLKYLEIVFCLGIETIEISNVNLVSFSYLGPGINLIINNVPMLDEISIGEGYSGLENNVFGQLSCCLYQLEVLTLDIYRPEENIKIFAFPQLPKLKQLILKVGAWDDDSLLEFTSLIKACPNLNRFVLQLIWMSPSKRRRKVRQAAKCAHEFLKLVEIVGDYGRTSDIELAMYFIENAIALQKIVIDPRNQILERSPVGTDQIKKEESARRRAKQQLEAKKPPGVQLIIL